MSSKYQWQQLMICRILDQTLTSKLATKAKGVQQWEIIFSEIVASQQPKKVKQEASHWVFYMQWFTFVMKHKSGASNKVANALSQRSLLLTSMTIIAKGFDSFKYLYPGNLSLVQFGKIVLMGSQESICCMMTSYSKETNFVFQIAHWEKRSSKTCMVEA